MARKKKNAVSDDQQDSETEIANEENGNGETQTELPNMPPSSPVGKAARAYLVIRKTIEALREKKGEALERLIEQMKAIKKETISVDGHVLQMEHVEECDTIKVRKPKISD